jgi:IS4 transposase
VAQVVGTACSVNVKKKQNVKSATQSRDCYSAAHTILDGGTIFKAVEPRIAKIFTDLNFKMFAYFLSAI